MAFLNYFNLYIIALLSILLAIFSSLFDVGISGILRHIVSTEQYPKALQQGQAIHATSNIVGGVIAGVLVSVIGVSGAYFIDASSYFFSIIIILMIKSKTTSDLDTSNESDMMLSFANKRNYVSKTCFYFFNIVHKWWKEFSQGIRQFAKIKNILLIVFLDIMLELVMAPIDIILPVFTKLHKKLPP